MLYMVDIIFYLSIRIVYHSSWWTILINHYKIYHLSDSIIFFYIFIYLFIVKKNIKINFITETISIRDSLKNFKSKSLRLNNLIPSYKNLEIKK
jgi:hypothetical protein